MNKQMIAIDQVEHFYYLFIKNAPKVDTSEYENSEEFKTIQASFTDEIYDKIDLIIQKLRMVKKSLAHTNYVTDELQNDFTPEAADRLNEIAEEFNHIEEQIRNNKKT